MMRKILLAACLAVVGAGWGATDAPEARKVANVVNFVRALDPRIPKAELMRALDEELALCERHGLPNTVLLQYDALVDADVRTVLRRRATAWPEFGLWFEMSRPHCAAAGLAWRGRPGWDWDWHIKPGFLMSYTPDQRRRLIDAAFAKFRATFGFTPRVVGSWLLDAWSVAYMTEKHGVEGFMICREQDATDAYGLRGGYSNGAYYPSRRNILSAATTMDAAIPVPVFKMLTPDPIYNYARMAFDKAVGSKPPTIEPVWSSGSTPATVDWYFRTYLAEGNLNLSYMQIGQENSFGWKMISKGLPMQLEKLAALRKAGKIEVETFGETARRFRRDHAANCAQSQVALEDWSSRGYQSVWYNCANYRVNVFLDGEILCLRDLHVMRDDFDEPYRLTACDSWKADYYTPPVFDEWLFDSGKSVGRATFDGTFEGVKTVRAEGGTTLEVLARRKDGSTLAITCRETGLEVRGGTLSAPVPAVVRKTLAVRDGGLELSFEGYRYRLGVCGEMKATATGLTLGGPSAAFTLHCAAKPEG